MTSYRVKVRPTITYLWGGAGITKPVSTPTHLTLRVDETGDPITFGSVDSQTQQSTAIGQLGPGEVYSLSLTSCLGVYATTGNHTWVTCVLELLR